MLPRLADRPLVSILVANYNYGHFLPETIQSILNQTYANWELIICDDGSTDNSVDVIMSHTTADDRIKLLRQENMGVAAATNNAFAMAAGDIVCLLDADDLFRPQKLEKVVAAFAATPTAGFAVHRMTVIDDQGRQVGEVPRGSLPNGWLGDRVCRSGGILYDLPPCSGLSLRAEVARAVFPLPPSFRAFHDGVLQLLSPLITDVVGLDCRLAEYRKHGKNMTGRTNVGRDDLARSVSAHQQIWGLQRQFLERLAPAAAGLLAPFESSFAHDVLRAQIAVEDGHRVAALACAVRILKKRRFRELDLPDKIRALLLAVLSARQRRFIRQVLHVR